MEAIKTITNNLGLIVGTLLLFVAILGSLRYAASRYKKVPPSRVGIIYGRRHVYEIPGDPPRKEELGFRLLTGGGAVVFPFVEDYAELNLGARLIPLEVKNIPTQGGVMVAAKGTATVLIGTDMPSLIAAARNFEGKKDESIDVIIRENLEGQLRAILGTLTIESLIGNREELNKAVLVGAETELLKLGVRVTILTIQNIWDESGYIESLGKRRIAEVKRDATVGEAHAQRDAQIAASNAKKEAELVAAQNAVVIAEAQKTRDVQVAQFKAQTDREVAMAAQAGALASAEMDKKVRQAKIEAEAAETQSRIALAEQETARVEKELQYQVIKPAEAGKQADVIKAEATKQTVVIQAEAEREKAIINADAQFQAAEKKAMATRTQAEAESVAVAKRGEGDAVAKKVVLLAEAEGQKASKLAEAEGHRAMLLAEAEGKKAEKLAQAEGTERQLLAEAAGVEARLMAEAKGKRELAEALAKLDATGRLLQVLDAAPRVAEALGGALAKALGPEGAANIFGQIAAPFGSVDKIHIIDMGNGQTNGHGALGKLVSAGPQIFFQFLAQAKALGFNLEQLLEKIGISSELLRDLQVAEAPRTETVPKQS